MDLEQVRSAAGREIERLSRIYTESNTPTDRELLARFAAAMLSTEPVQDGENDVMVTAEQFAQLLDPLTRGQLAALRLALGLPLTAGGEEMR